MACSENTAYRVGDLAARSGCKVETVRYYEKTGLMPDPPRSGGGHRVYTLAHLKRLFFIRRSRALGFPIEQVRELLRFIDEPDHSCSEVQGMAISHAQAVQAKIDDLKRLRTALDEMAVRCKGAPYPADDCPIIDALFADMDEG